MNKQYEFNNAIDINDQDVIKLLIKDNEVDPALDDNFAIRCSSRNGNLNVVKLLLKDNRVDPSALFNFAIYNADRNKFTNIVKLLWNDKRVKNTLEEDYEQLYIKLKLQIKISTF